MQSLSALPPDFASSPHCDLMSALQALTTAEVAKAECVMSRAALSAAMQVKVLISMSSGCNARISARVKSEAPFGGRAFLEHDADGGNDFLVQARVAVDDPVIAHERGSAWRPPVTLERHHAGAH
jgi:hypothetical protein